MKLQVITDEAGDILGTLRLDVEAIEGGPGPTGLIPESGQELHEVEVADEMRGMSVDDFHRSLREKIRRR